jgi:transposase
VTASQPNGGITKVPNLWIGAKMTNGDVPCTKGRFSIGAFLCPTRSMVSDVDDTHIGEMLSIIPLGRMSILRTSGARHVTLSTYQKLEANMSDNKINYVRKSSAKEKKMSKELELLNLNAAGIDIGSQQHYVAVPEGRDEVSVRSFASFTPDLYKLAAWLKKCGIETVAMESTGVYWIPLYEILSSKGFEVNLVNARHVKNVSGRKTDVLDCQWIQQLHTYGLLSGAFRPNDQICQLRAYNRQREMLVAQAAKHVLHMQKALSQMNIQLHNVLSDVTGKTGLKIIRAIVSGEHDPKKLAEYRDGRCKNSLEIIEKSLVGNYREEHLFALKQAVELYDIYHEKIRTCDEEIEKLLSNFDGKIDLDKTDVPKSKAGSKKENSNTPKFDLHKHLFRITGVNLTALPGINSHTAFKVLSETGVDMSCWPTEKHFVSWLGLCPGNKVSGGKRLPGRSTPTANRAATSFRMAASTLFRNKSALGAFHRRMKGRLGPAKAVTATAHKLAKLFYKMLKYGESYVEKGQDYYEQQYKNRVVKNLQKRAQQMGFKLVAEPNFGSA